MKKLKKALSLSLALVLSLSLALPAASAEEAKEWSFDLITTAGESLDLPDDRIGEGFIKFLHPISEYGTQTYTAYIVPDGATIDKLNIPSGDGWWFDSTIRTIDVRSPELMEESDGLKWESTELTNGMNYTIPNDGYVSFRIAYNEELTGGGTTSWYVGSWDFITETYANLLSASNTVTFERFTDATLGDGGFIVSKWALDSFNKASEQDLIPSYMFFDLRENITRAEFAAVTIKLYEAMSGQTAPDPDWSSNPFTDTWDQYARKAYELGFVSGMGDGTFAPDNLVTREQAASMLSRVYTKLGGNIPTVTATTFADNASVSSWARDSVAFMADKGILSGVGDNNFNPQGSATVEQALAIALRMFENLK